MNKIKIFAAVASIFLLLAGCTKSEGDFVIKINGEAVYENEFKLYLQEAITSFESIGGADIWETDFEGQQAADVAKESAINGVTLVKLSAQKAKEMGVDITDDDKKKLNDNIDALYESLGSEALSTLGVNKSEYYDIMYQKELYSAVFNEITKNYEPSQYDFEKYYEANKEEYADLFTLYTIQSVLIEDTKKAKEALEKARSGTSFDEIIDEYEIDQTAKDQGTEMKAYRLNLESLLGVEFNLDKGDISDALYTNDGYYIIKVINVEQSTDDELITFAKSEYTMIKKREVFSGEYNKWLSLVKIERNSELIDNINIK